MGWFEGMIGGFGERKSQVEAQNIRESELSNQRESRIYETLLSSPDPDIQAMAATGLLESAQPRKKKGGLRGWMGEVATNPTFEKLKQLIGTPVQTSPGTPDELAHTDYSGGSGGQLTTAPSAEAPMGTPNQSLTQPGARPAMTPSPKPIPAAVGKPPTYGPRHVFASTEDTAIATARGKAEGDVEGDIAGYMAAGMSREAAVSQVRSERVRAGGAHGGANAQSVAGEVVGPDGRVVPAFGVFDRARQLYLDPSTQQPLQGFRPRTTTGSTSMGADREAISRELFGMPFAQLNQTQQGNVNATAISRTRDIAKQRGLGTGEAKIATELATPIGPSAARQYNVAPTTTLQELQNTVGLNDTQKDRVYAITQMDTLIDDIDALIPQVFPNVPEGFKGNIKTMFSLGVQQLAGDADLAKLDAAISAALAQVAQLTGQPGSRLSDKDLELAKNTLTNLQPSLFNGDTINTARARVTVIRDLLARAKGSIPTSPMIGAPPPAGGKPQAATGTPPPTAATSSGPAGWFVVDGKLVQGEQLHRTP